MRKVVLFSSLLVFGLIASQAAPTLAPGFWPSTRFPIQALTFLALAYIMIRVGSEFEIDKRNLRQYGWDYVVAATAAAFPWIFCCLYFVFVMLPQTAWSDGWIWREGLLASRFSAPTSAGVLFSMLIAAGLSATWLFRKARVLAIFDDLDTVLLMLPLKMALVGLRWQLGVVVAIMVAFLVVGWRLMKRLDWSMKWTAVLGYSVVLVVFTEGLYLLSKNIDARVPIHVEILFPAFLLGMMIKVRHEDHHDAANHRADAIVSAAFMVLVGLSMPEFIGSVGAAAPAVVESASHIAAKTPPMGWGQIAFHVLMITALSNIGKMFPAFCYRKEASFHERLALAIGMWPRGEVGAGVLVLALSYGIGGPIVVVAMLSLALNLLLTGVFIVVIKSILRRGGVEAPLPVPTAAH
ncbi:MAG: sodium:proton antiporter [Phycisphaerae bacterium]|nr:sodium:proton antiporter [Phycisphaerae bacterium]